ncbi:MAG: hypothetical protein IPI77_24035 [Saprospiraceae bacterium]|nr:hypothetical protein [Saprospiraceae bacterium]
MEKNIAIMGELLDKSSQAGCQMICLPEGWPTNYTGIRMHKHDEYDRRQRVSNDGPQSKTIWHVYVSGFIQLDRDMNNVAALYNRQGGYTGYL